MNEILIHVDFGDGGQALLELCDYVRGQVELDVYPLVFQKDNLVLFLQHIGHNFLIQLPFDVAFYLPLRHEYVQHQVVD